MLFMVGNEHLMYYFAHIIVRENKLAYNTLFWSEIISRIYYKNIIISCPFNITQY